MSTISRFEARLANIPADIWVKIAKIDEIKGTWTAGVSLSPYVLGRLKCSVLVTSTGASTRIEGARLSDEDIEAFIKGMKIQTFSDRDSQEVRGYYELLQNVFDAWKDVPLTEGMVKHFHKELLQYTEKDERHRGDYKKTENRVEMFDTDGKSIGVVFETTPAYLTPKEMQELVEWTAEALESQGTHPLLIVANFVVEFLKIHPFQDGNGRLSRVLTNLLLLKSGYLYVAYVSHEKLIEDNKDAYYLALRKSQKSFGGNDESILPWVEFFLGMLLSQAEMALELLARENIESELSPKQLDIWKYLQLVDEATPGEISRNTGIAKPTVAQGIRKLIGLRKVERIGMGRATRYRKTADR